MGTLEKSGMVLEFRRAVVREEGAKLWKLDVEQRPHFALQPNTGQLDDGILNRRRAIFGRGVERTRLVGEKTPCSVLSETLRLSGYSVSFYPTSRIRGSGRHCNDIAVFLPTREDTVNELGAGQGT